MCRPFSRSAGGFAFKDLLILLLIVAAVFAVAVPVFGPTVESILEMVDRYSIYNAYSELLEASVIGPDSEDNLNPNEGVVKYGNLLVRQVSLKQLQKGWQEDPPTVGGTLMDDFSGKGLVRVRISYNQDTRDVFVEYIN